MKPVRLALVFLAGALVARTAAGAGQRAAWRLPRDREVYLKENDLVYARFLALAQGGAYRQINRDERGSVEVDRGRWEQDASGTLRLHSSCRALRPRGLSSGPLSVALSEEGAFAGLPGLLASVQGLLAANPDTVFGAETMVELNKTGMAAVRLDGGAVTFDRGDAVTLAALIESALASERNATYLLEPVGNGSRALFALQGSVFGVEHLADVRRTYGISDGALPPFYFARVEAKAYAAEVGRWEPLHLPGGAR